MSNYVDSINSFGIKQSENGSAMYVDLTRVLLYDLNLNELIYHISRRKGRTSVRFFVFFYLTRSQFHKQVKLVSAT